MIAWATKLTLVKIAPFAAIALVFALGASHWYAYSNGVTRERDRQEAALLTMEQQALARQEALADEIEQARQARQLVVRDRIRIVDRVVDSAGCADATVPDGVLSALRGIDRED